MMKQKKAVFLDRDGVINKELGDYVCRFEDFEILPHVAPGLKILQEAGFELIIITNQGGLAKGLYTVEELNRMHAHLEAAMQPHGIRFADIYYCQHHPQHGNCLCRKPGSLLVEKALSKHGIAASQSWFIGDKQRDMDSGAAAGVKGILIEPNEDWILHAHNIVKQAEA